MLSLRTSKRNCCVRCFRPTSTCICGWITPLQSEVDLLVLQHPQEVSNAKGSARLLFLSFNGCFLLEGEQFDAAELDQRLHAGGRIPLLLYPEMPGERALGLPASPPLAPGLLDNPSSLRLVVLDGTWRKSRKMLYLNPALQALPRLALRELAPSRYLIRKAHAAHQLSTLEATCHALAQLEGKPERYAPLLDAFGRFVAQFQATRGRLHGVLEKETGAA
ncbi:MAG: tRNA-uridine aminocarboxypropyltransferase [Pseudomonadota bacterium]